MPHIQSFFWVILLFSAIIVPHELAHLCAAAITGVQVEIFSLGFGRRLFGFHLGPTDFRLAAIPLGGYVRLRGEDPNDPTAKTDPYSFHSKSRIQRAFILLAGPIMNALLTTTILTGLYWHGFIEPIHTTASRIEVATVLEKSPAQQAGILPGDTVTAINHVPISTPQTAIDAIKRSEGKPIVFLLHRNNESLAATVLPRIQEQGPRTWRIGAAFQVPMQTVKLPLPQAAAHATTATIRLASMILESFKGLLTGHIAPSTLLGPIGIAQISREAARRGLSIFLAFTAILSLNLGLFNLLPIPILDGGSLTILVCEMAMRRDLTPKIKENIMKAGFLILVGITGAATYNDVVRTLSAATTPITQTIRK